MKKYLLTDNFICPLNYRKCSLNELRIFCFLIIFFRLAVGQRCPYIIGTMPNEKAKVPVVKNFSAFKKIYWKQILSLFGHPRKYLWIKK